MIKIFLIVLVVASLFVGKQIFANTTQFVASPMTSFQDVATEAGIYQVEDIYGPTIGDINYDDKADIYLTNHQGGPDDFYSTLFQQDSSGGTFSDIITSTQIIRGGDKHAAVFGDCNNDGYLDLYTSLGGDAGTDQNKKNRLETSDGTTFTDIAESAGVTDPGSRGRAASWIDYNNDGNLDVYLNNAYKADYSDKLYRNDGNCTFTDVSTTSGDIASRHHRNGSVWADFDNDGDMDVLAVSGPNLISGSNDFNYDLYKNNGDGTFSDVTTAAGLYDEPGRSANWGDYDNDGDMDLFVTTGSNTIPSRLYRNNGDSTFTEVGAGAGVAQVNTSQDVLWADFNNDGYLDLYITNLGDSTTTNPNYLYRNKGDGTFEDVALTVGAAGIWGQSSGAALLDYNTDGFMDVLITNAAPEQPQPGPHQLLKNLGGNNLNWIEIKLVGTQANKMGIGARVLVETPDGNIQTRQLNGGIHRYSQDEQILHFGLGTNTDVSNIKVYWPGGGYLQEVSSQAANQRITITDSREPAPTPEPTPTPTPGPTEVIVDNEIPPPSISSTGNWSVVSYPSSYNGNHLYSPAGTGLNQVTFTPNLTAGGNYEVYIWRFTAPQSATNAPFTINYNGGSNTTLVNLRSSTVSAGGWYSLGIYNFLAGELGSVAVTDNANGKVRADVVKLTPR